MAASRPFVNKAERIKANVSIKHKIIAVFLFRVGLLETWKQSSLHLNRTNQVPTFLKDPNPTPLTLTAETIKSTAK